MAAHGKNEPLLERHRTVMPSWLALYYEEPIQLKRGEGRRVWDENDREYLDFFGGILTTMTGYNTPEVVAAIQDQAGKMLHSSTLYLIDSQVELAEEIAELSGIPDAKVFFTNSGSEANDTALMLATAYRRSNQILAMRHSYHGRSFSAVSTTGTSSWSPSSLSPFNVSYVHGAYRFRSPFRQMTDDDYMDACVHDLENVLEVATAGDVACLIAEPIQGVGGFGMPPDGLYGRFNDVLKKKDILFIADEVQTGWGRTGEHFWGYQAHGFTPDILTFAKGLGNGLAIGGLVARKEIMDCFNANSISTFGGNPLVTRGSLANLKYLQDNNLQANAAKQGKRLIEKLRKLAADTPMIGDVRGKGLMVGIECVGADGRTPNVDAVVRLMEVTKQNGLLIGKGGFYGNVVRIAPPLSITEAEIDVGVDILAAAIKTVSA